MKTLLRLVVLNLARSLVGFVREHGVNDGEFVRWFQAITGNEPPAAWCISCALRIVFCVAGPWITLKKTGRCSDFAEWAHIRGLVVADPQPGFLLLVYHAKEGRVAHACIIEHVNEDHTVDTIGGNEADPSLDPQDPKSREGLQMTWRKGPNARKIGPKDVIVDWTKAIDEPALAKAAA